MRTAELKRAVEAAPALLDMACLRSLPNIPIIQPGDEIETKQAIAFAVDYPGPLYLHVTRRA